jgi:hypothetical protein
MRILDSDESRQLYGIIAVFSTRGKTALNNHLGAGAADFRE